MAVSLKKLNEQIMVITGVSSGIGLVTARMAAKHGARLVLPWRPSCAQNVPAPDSGNGRAFSSKIEQGMGRG